MQALADIERCERRIIRTIDLQNDRNNDGAIADLPLLLVCRASTYLASGQVLGGVGTEKKQD